MWHFSTINRSVFPDLRATRDSWITHANPLHRSRSEISIYHEKNTNGPAHLHPPEFCWAPCCGTSCTEVTMWLQTSTRTCMHAHSTHTLPSGARQTHLAPDATTSFVLLVAPGYKLNYTSSNSQLPFIPCTTQQLAPRSLQAPRRSPMRFLKSIKYYTSAKWRLSKL